MEQPGNGYTCYAAARTKAGPQGISILRRTPPMIRAILDFYFFLRYVLTLAAATAHTRTPMSAAQSAGDMLSPVWTALS